MFTTVTNLISSNFEANYKNELSSFKDVLELNFLLQKLMNFLKILRNNRRSIRRDDRDLTYYRLK